MSAGRQVSRLTPWGVFVLVSVFLMAGPTVSFALGIPVNLVDHYVVSLATGVGLDQWGANHQYFWGNLLGSPVIMVIGLPFYSLWAETHLLHVTAWVTCAVTLLATSPRGLRVWDAAAIAAFAVAIYPFLIAADSPLLTWSYPDAAFMAVSAASGAAVCVTLVRGLGATGRRRRIAWGWLWS